MAERPTPERVLERIEPLVRRESTSPETVIVNLRFWAAQEDWTDKTDEEAIGFYEAALAEFDSELSSRGRERILEVVRRQYGAQ